MKKKKHGNGSKNWKSKGMVAKIKRSNMVAEGKQKVTRIEKEASGSWQILQKYQRGFLKNWKTSERNDEKNERGEAGKN